MLAQEVFRFHVLAQRTIEIVLSTVVDTSTVETIVESHVIYHVLDGIRLLLFCQTSFDLILCVDALGFPFEIVSLCHAVCNENSQLLRCLGRVQENVIFADWAAQVCKGDALSLPLSDPAIDALSMVDVSAGEAHRGLRAKLVDMADAAHIRGLSVD